MDMHEIEGLAALAENWREAGEAGDGAAAQALEDELHARIDPAGIAALQAPDPRAGESSAGRSAELRGTLEAIWGNAEARLG